MNNVNNLLFTTCKYSNFFLNTSFLHKKDNHILTQTRQLEQSIDDLISKKRSVTGTNRFNAVEYLCYR